MRVLAHAPDGVGKDRRTNWRHLPRRTNYGAVGDCGRSYAPVDSPDSPVGH